MLIFQQEGKYLLDSAGDAAETEECLQFSSLDELVLFLTGYNLKVGEDEVQLTGTCPCAQDAMRMSSNCECWSVYCSSACELVMN